MVDLVMSVKQKLWKAHLWFWSRFW